MPSGPQPPALTAESLRKVHHIALNVRDINASRHFYGNILGLHELTGDEVPSTLVPLITAGKVANFVTPDGTIRERFRNTRFDYVGFGSETAPYIESIKLAQTVQLQMVKLKYMYI